MIKEFWIKRDNLRETKFVEVDTPKLGSNQLLLKIEHFAFTANNVSYGQTGETLGYWQFFPTGAEAWGKLPVWGYAAVIASNQPQIPVGERFYGFLPLASHLVLQTDKLSAAGFTDTSPHRQALPIVYNRYAHSPKGEDEYLNSLLRPMFVTAFLLDDFLDENDFFGAEQVVVSSASSKTAYAMAHLSHQRGKPELIGLTSPKNSDFVKSLGIYDTVLSYDEITALPDVPTAYVDFASNADLRKKIHEQFGENLLHDTLVGGTHWDKVGSAKGLEVDKPEFFFAPVRIQKRLVDWGREGYQERSETAYARFIEAARDWIDIRVGQGQDAVLRDYQSMLDGESQPRAGIILSL